jgi:hypothetical protein
MRRVLLSLAFIAAFCGTVHAQCLLKQSTAAQEISIGPFLDSTDGDSEETGLSIANTDVRLKKGTANWASKNSGGGTAEEHGNYAITLDATDTATLGILEIFVHKSGALAVWKTCFVLEANEYDSLVGADVKQVDITQVRNSTINTLISGRVDVSVGAAAADTITASSLATDAITEIQTGLKTAPRAIVFTAYKFKLRNADGTAYTAGTSANITCTRTLDAGSLASCAASTVSSIVHEGQGVYRANIAASDMTANSIWIKFLGPNCASTSNNCWEQFITTQH